MKNKTFTIIVLSLVIGFFLFLIVQKNPTEIQENNIDFVINENEFTVVKSMYCGCCGGYISELGKKGFDVRTIVVEDISPVKEKYNIPGNMQSCHTSFYKGYIIEGHIPIEAIEKLLEEQPDIDGIALPGMPSGSLGMPGQKTEIWTIYSFKDGASSEFMTI